MTDNNINLSFGENKTACGDVAVDKVLSGNSKYQKYWDTEQLVICIFGKHKSEEKLPRISDTCAF